MTMSCVGYPRPWHYDIWVPSTDGAHESAVPLMDRSVSSTAPSAPLVLPSIATLPASVVECLPLADNDSCALALVPCTPSTDLPPDFSGPPSQIVPLPFPRARRSMALKPFGSEDFCVESSGACTIRAAARVWASKASITVGRFSMPRAEAGI